MSDRTPMWSHDCTVQGAGYLTGKGEPCSWCGATEQSEASRYADARCGACGNYGCRGSCENEPFKRMAGS